MDAKLEMSTICHVVNDHSEYMGFCIMASYETIWFASCWRIVLKDGTQGGAYSGNMTSMFQGALQLQQTRGLLTQTIVVRMASEVADFEEPFLFLGGEGIRKLDKENRLSIEWR